jgi:alkylation response protein AidB-like acyl-CoA dehydrogenase
MAKCCAVDVALRITTDSVQVSGGRGQMHDDSTEKYVRDAGIAEIHEGTSQIQ